VNIIVPAFIPPPGFGKLPDWMPIYRAGPTVRAAVLNIDLDNLDPKVPFPTFKTSLGVWGTTAPGLVTDAHTQAPGLLVLGYVPTDSATAGTNAPTLDGSAKKPYRTLPDIQCYVDHWYALCPALDGIFFDEGPAAYRFTGAPAGTPFPSGYTVDPQIQKFYMDLCSHVKTKVGGRGTHVILNASEFMDEWVMMGPPSQPLVADTVVLFEGECAKYEHRYTAQPWIGRYPADRILHVIHSCRGYRCLSARDEMIRMVALAQERGAGNVYVFDGTSSAYNKLPLYWTEEVAAVSDTCTAIRGARDQAFYKLLHLMREARPRVVGGGGFPDVHLAWDCFAVWAEMIWRARRLNC
jgi:hypothetical protein